MKSSSHRSALPGAIFFNPTSDFKSINFVGEVLQGELLLPIASGFSIHSSRIPQPGRLHTDLIAGVAVSLVTAVLWFAISVRRRLRHG